jgi:hypothetical protein
MRASWSALLLLFPAVLPAQTRSEPNLVFSFSFGLTTGKDLWRVPEQPVPVVGGTGEADTVDLARVLRPGATITLSGTLYRSPSFGFTAEVGYYGIASEQRCIGPAVYQPDGDNTNQQLCTSAHGTHRPTSVVGFQLGAAWRLASAARVSPYLRATAGLGVIGNSYIETTGIQTCPQGACTTPLIAANTNSLTWIGSLTGGLAVKIAPAYRLRMELRDVVTAVPVPDGPGVFGVADPIAPASRRVIHVPTFLLGLDLVFERRHTRRY